MVRGSARWLDRWSRSSRAPTRPRWPRRSQASRRIAEESGPKPEARSLKPEALFDPSCLPENLDRLEMIPQRGVAPGAAPRLVARFDVGPAFEEHLNHRGFAPARRFDERRASLGIADIDVCALAREELHRAPLLHGRGGKQRRGPRAVFCLERRARRKQRADGGGMARPRGGHDCRIDASPGTGLLEQPDDLQIAA